MAVFSFTLEPTKICGSLVERQIRIFHEWCIKSLIGGTASDLPYLWQLLCCKNGLFTDCPVDKVLVKFLRAKVPVRQGHFCLPVSWLEWNVFLHTYWILPCLNSVSIHTMVEGGLLALLLILAALDKWAKAFFLTWLVVFVWVQVSVFQEGLSTRKLRGILGPFSQSLRNNSSQSWCFN